MGKNTQLLEETESAGTRRSKGRRNSPSTVCNDRTHLPGQRERDENGIILGEATPDKKKGPGLKQNNDETVGSYV